MPLDSKRGGKTLGLSFKQPVITRGGNNVRIYHIYEHEIHGAYESGDGSWHIARWELDGHFHPVSNQGRMITTLDLINDV